MEWWRAELGITSNRFPIQIKTAKRRPALSKFMSISILYYHSINFSRGVEVDGIFKWILQFHRGFRVPKEDNATLG